MHESTCALDSARSPLATAVVLGLAWTFIEALLLQESLAILQGAAFVTSQALCGAGTSAMQPFATLFVICMGRPSCLSQVNKGLRCGRACRDGEFYGPSSVIDTKIKSLYISNPPEQVCTPMCRLGRNCTYLMKSTPRPRRVTIQNIVKGGNAYYKRTSHLRSLVLAPRTQTAKVVEHIN